MLVREMPVLAAARIIGVTDQRLWRIVEHYVTQAVTRLDLSRLNSLTLQRSLITSASFQAQQSTGLLCAPVVNVLPAVCRPVGQHVTQVFE